MKGWCHIQICLQSEGYCFFLINFHLWHQDLGSFVRKSCCTGSVRKSLGKVKDKMTQSSSFTIEVNWSSDFIEKLLQARAHTPTCFECLQTFYKKVRKKDKNRAQLKANVIPTVWFYRSGKQENFWVWIVVGKMFWLFPISPSAESWLK